MIEIDANNSSLGIRLQDRFTMTAKPERAVDDETISRFREKLDRFAQ